MKRLSFLGFLAGLLFSFRWGLAAELSLRSDTLQKSGHFGTAFEYTQFEFPTAKILGAGLRLTYFHEFTDNLGAELGMSAAFSSDGGLQNSFTGFSGFGYYNLLGDLYPESRVIYSGSDKVLTETNSARQSLQVGLGLSQYFLNGTRGVYSNSGLGAGVAYKIQVYSWHIRTSARYHVMRAGQFDVKAVAVDLGLIFPL